VKLHSIEHRACDKTVIRGWATEKRGLPLILFLHGNGFAGRVYTPFLEPLAERYDVLILDLPGHGGSDTLWPLPGLVEIAERVHTAVINTGRNSSSQIIGVGHSIGSVITMLCAFHHPETYQSLVLLDPILYSPQSRQRNFARLRAGS